MLLPVVPLRTRYFRVFRGSVGADWEQMTSGFYLSTFPLQITPATPP